MSDRHDIVSERQILALALSGHPAVAKRFIVLPHKAFYSPVHEVVATVLRDRIRRKIPINARVVAEDAASLAGTDHKSEQVRRFVLDASMTAPPAESFSYYAEEVVKYAGLRTAAEHCDRLAQHLAVVESLEDMTTAVRGAVAGLTDVESALAPQAIEPPMSLQALLDQEDEPYDWLIPDLLERMDRLIITGFEGTGKALALDTAIPTPKGWTTMGALSVGEEVFGPDGRPARVVAATDVMRGRPCYRVTFSDGAQIVADANHLWLTETLPCREATARFARRGPDRPYGMDQRHKRVHHPEVVTTRQIADTLHARGGHALNHSIETIAPLQYPAQEVPVDPYVLGAWLGDGSALSGQITSADGEIVDQIRAAGYTVEKAWGPYAWRVSRRVAAMEARKLASELVESGVSSREACRRVGLPEGSFRALDASRSGWRRVNIDPELWGPALNLKSLRQELRELGVLDNKHIPETYQRSSVEQRLALLQGLMDTDGTIGTDAICEFSVCDQRLARDAHELMLGLGIKVTWREAPAVLNGRQVGTRYRLCFKTDLKVFRLSRKANRQAPLPTRRATLRYITAVEPVESVGVRCIQVDRADGLFVAGRECITTHNSVLLAQIAMTIAAGIHPFTGSLIEANGFRVMVLDCENSPKQLRRRYRSMVSRVNGAREIHGLRPVDWSTNLRLDIRPEGVDLTNAQEFARIEQSIAATAPDLVVAGPLYRMHKMNINDEQAARELVDALDRLRVKYRFALVCEAHVGHVGETSGGRKLRPTGSSLFLRWPEFGYGIRAYADGIAEEHPSVVELVSWRGARDERRWPSILRHSQYELPWTPGDLAYRNHYQMEPTRPEWSAQSAT